MKLILASKSPRRRELFDRLNLDYYIDSVEIDESPLVGESPKEMVCRLAYEKAKAVSQIYKDYIVIGSDTIVSYKGEKLGKPKDINDAKRMLKMLSSDVHEVITAISIINYNSKIHETEYLISRVKFRDLSDQIINDYLNTTEPYDKAGSYAIQGLGSILVESIEGDYQNIVGMSPVLLDRLLIKTIGKGIFELRKS